MKRTDGDDWSISESVGTTALGTAEARAAEADQDHPLFIDTYARALIEAAKQRGWTSPFSGDEPGRQPQVDAHTAARVRAMWDFVAARTRWFDDYFEGASAAGARQVVILAAGLDARAWRLGWADDTAIFEIDQPQVLAFKTETLSGFSIAPGVRHLPVSADLRGDWPKNLCDNGFDPDMPTAWAAEGLLVYLPATAQDRLFDRIQTLSSAGSFIAVEGFSDTFFAPERIAGLNEQFRATRDAILRAGGEIPDTPDLFYVEQRADIATWLTERGWSINTVGASDLMARYQRSAAAEFEAAIPLSVFIDGQLL